MTHFDVVVLGAGAAGMMCAATAGQRGRSVLVLDHARAPGEKIRISGGGRCNFTNINTRPANFISRNPAFCISALRRYRPADFIGLVDRYAIAWHEKTLGQLFCDDSAKQIVDMMLSEMAKGGVSLRLSTTLDRVERTGAGFSVIVGSEVITCNSLVVATGGKSIPKMGATGLGYDLARQFDLAVTEIRPALVPLTFEVGLLDRLKPLAGVATPARIKHDATRFDEAMLFTHRGLSGPAVLQISSYWREGEAVEINMAPGVDLFAELKKARATSGRQAPQTALSEFIPKRLAQHLVEAEKIQGNLADCSDVVLRKLCDAVQAWRVKPVGSEGYRTAEVTLGGVDTDGLDSRTLAARAVPGLFFIGEVVDVTGWLGGYNFQWAWASGWCAGQAA